MEVSIISSTIQEFMGVRYYKCGRYFQRKGVRLHRVVWEHDHGPIPDGFHVHHVDHDPTNNDPSNLSLEHGSEHISYHSLRSGAGAKNVRRAIAAASVWHGSDDGIEWHRQHYEANCKVALSQRIDKTCDNCGTQYRTKISARTTGRFCSNNCKSAWRRKAGLDHEQRTCAACGKSFTVNKYYPTKSCSGECGRKLAHSSR